MIDVQKSVNQFDPPTPVPIRVTEYSSIMRGERQIKCSSDEQTISLNMKFIRFSVRPVKQIKTSKQ